MKTFNTLRVILVLLGVGMLVGAFFFFQSTSAFLETATAKPGVVTDLVRSRSSDSYAYYPLVRFEDEQGRLTEFLSSSGSNPPSYSRGETVRVLFTPGETDSARIDGFFSLWGATLIIGCLGGVFFLLGAGMFVVPAVRNGGAVKLRKTGQLVQGIFQGVENNNMIVINGKSPYQIVCQWQNPVTSDIHVFRSGNLWFDPSEYIRNESIPVYINPTNPRRYWVDTSFLPKMAR
ncbi:MAG: DUF3592 domain-containing protein [Marinobacter sp.]|uniref:DUF3592 domain-containing protein n=1 Tax=Marinobacter sp. TaxID=50741 RepID=UPI00396E2C5F